MRVIKCWEDAMVQMQVGEKADIGCPSATAYGAKSKPKIPANSDLIFNVEVVSCEWEKSSIVNIWDVKFKWKRYKKINGALKILMILRSICIDNIISLWH